MEAAHSHSGAVAIPKANTGAIWRTFWILLAVTSLEFLIAFTVDGKLIRITTFLLLTLVKAFYIVGEFMHLKHEVKSLIWSILIPTIFVVWLVVALMYEGGSILMAR
ncbi:MAG TPA: cytochrome C oxidase subunit IV family protein [Catalimonadaceae bacterium]|jgi:cytochrome c oxidase subunit 4|nr:cytochrome C oxidase subunit IV family protein [Catalimonadaceae bacterium]